MQTYKQYAPTGFDPKGLMATDDEEGRGPHGSWFVVPVIRTRDSCAPDGFFDSNFHVALRMLGGESETIEVHRFGHWGPGWFEIILVHPSRETEVQEIEDSLEDYPLLDESDHSERESEYVGRLWENMRVKDRLDEIHKANENSREKISIFAARRDYLPEDPAGRLWERLSRD